MTTAKKLKQRCQHDIGSTKETRSLVPRDFLPEFYSWQILYFIINDGHVLKETLWNMT
jgi:hypothetical protein